MPSHDRWARRATAIVAAAAVATFAAFGVQSFAANDPVERGRALFSEHCVECHGTTGKGDGPASFMLRPRPRDLTSGKYEIRSTETGTLPTDADLVRTVRQGLYGTSMPAWDTLLPESDILALVAFVKTLSPRFATDRLSPVPAMSALAPTPESVARGGSVYAKLQCGKCHGTDGQGTGAVVAEFQDDWLQPLRATDLTEPWTFRGGASAEDIYLRFRTGMNGTPMPSFNEAATDTEMADLANYIVSLARKPVWEMNASEVSAFYAKQEADARANPVKRGQYLAESMDCVVCHTPHDEQKRMIPGMKWAGGLRIRIEPFGDYPTGNLTSDRETGLGGWTNDEIRQAVTRGTLRDGTRLAPYPMDWASYATLTSEDLDALVAYLRTLPPVRNKVPPPSRTFLPFYLWGKFRMLILGNDPPMLFYPGNAGSKS